MYVGFCFENIKMYYDIFLHSRQYLFTFEIEDDLSEELWRPVDVVVPNRDLEVLFLELVLRHLGVDHSLLPLRVAAPGKVTRSPLVLYPVAEKLVVSVEKRIHPLSFVY